jgi:hypothetical protein
VLGDAAAAAAAPLLLLLLLHVKTCTGSWIGCHILLRSSRLVQLAMNVL